MPEPHPFPCGGINQPACPPVPAITTNGVAIYTEEDMRRHGAACYAKGAADHAAATTKRVPRIGDQ